MFYLRSILVFFLLSFFTLVFAQHPLPYMDEGIFHEPPIPGPENHDPSFHLMSSPIQPDVYIDDFLVNEQEGNAAKFTPNVAINRNGIVFVVWSDYRNGNQMSFGQILDSTGKVQGPEFQINTLDKNRSYSYPDVAVNDKGNFLVVWVDSRSWNNIYARMYSEDGLPIGEEVNLKDDLARAHQYAPRVAYNNNQFVVVWYDTRDGYTYDIYGQRLDANGSKIDTNFVVNDDIQGTAKYQPVLAVDNDGGFLVSWYSASTDYYNIFAREFNPNGTPRDSVYQMNENTPNTRHYTPEVALSDTGYVVVWYDYRTGRYRVWGQYYARDRGPVGKNLEISDSDGTYNAYNNRVESYGNNELIVTWRDTRNGSMQYYGQRIKGDKKIDSNILLTDLIDRGDKWYSGLACDDNGNFVQVWVDRGLPMNHHIKARRYSSGGKPKEASFRIDTDENSSKQDYPAIAVREDGSFITAWQDERSRRRDVFYQQFSNKGAMVDTNKADTTPATSYKPDIAIGKDGSFILTWHESRSPVYEIIAQRFDKSGLNIGDPFIVSTNEEGTHSYDPIIASNKNGQFVITWRQYVNNVYKIYVQPFNSDGDSVGSNILVSQHPSTATHTSPRVGIDSTGVFAVVWYTTAYSTKTDSDIMMQRYSAEGIPLGETFMVNDDSTNSNQYYSDISVHEDGETMVAWQDYRSLPSVYYQKFSHIGSSDNFARIDSNIAITAERYYAYNIRVAMNAQKDFVISFSRSNGENNDVLFKSFNQDGTTHSDISQISASTEREQANLNLAFVGDKIYNIWQDNHVLGMGYDIYANVINWNDLVTNVDGFNALSPADYNLEQNYPNPFNPRTIISYQLSVIGKIDLSIYNILGQKVATLVSKNQVAGIYQVEWDASGFASGIYYYQLRTEAGFIQTKKMVLVK